MRPAQSLINALLSHTASVDLALIAWGQFRYTRQELPVTGSLHVSRFEHLFSSEAAMKPQPPQSDKNFANEDSTSQNEADAPAKPESRADKLARIRAEINAGTYDTEEKMEAALDRLIGRISWE